MNSNRLFWIDNIKCFAIMLVVLGHLIQYVYCPDTFDGNHLFRYIYSFHMPLFMVISGFLIGLKSEYIMRINFFNSIMKRARQLLVPFLSWALAVSLIKQNFSLFFNIIKQPDNGLWFLWALFFIYIAFLATMFLNRFCKNSLICSLLILCGLYCCSFIMNGILGSNLIAKYYLYYMVGYFIAKKDIIDSVPNKKKNVIMLLCLLSFILLGYFWKRTEYVFIPFEQFIYNKFINKLFNILTALLGIISIILIFKTIKRTHYIVSYIGQRTLAIYAIHFFVLDFFILPNNNIFFLIVILPIVIVVSLLFEYLLSLNKYTSLFFLGKTS